MKISQKNKQKLFNSISEIVADLKVQLCRINGKPLYHTDEKLDERITFLDIEIWKNIKKNLNIED